jgi:IMP cyclohydrolase
MPNPNGPYPGRQLFLGVIADGKPAFAYLVTGRSSGSRERKATHRENSIIMGPLGNVPYDALKHYIVVKYDDATGILAVTNGIQTEAIYETYRLLHGVGTAPTADYMEKIMEGAGAEPDSLNTPRIAGVVTIHDKAVVQFVSIKRKDIPAKAFKLNISNGTFTGVSTYNGDSENPTPFTSLNNLPQIKFNGKDAKELAEYLYKLSEASYKGDDIRVCAVGGIYSSGKWAIAMVNKHQG